MHTNECQPSGVANYYYYRLQVQWLAGCAIHGPLCRFLTTPYGKVTGFAFGPHGVGDQVEALVGRIAKGTAELQWRQMGARSVKEALANWLYGHLANNNY